MVDLASIYFGLFVGVFIFTIAKVITQTRSIWKRTHSFHNTYLYLIWAEAWTNFIFAIVTFLFLNNVIKGSLVFFLFTVVLWALQTQLLPQIIANRVSLIMTNKRRAKHLKWSLVVSIGLINIAVCYIWTVAHMKGATPAQVHHNVIFEKVEKIFFLIIDLGLNMYFLYLVRYRLIEDGLSKYWRLFNFNAGMVGISTTMDILLLGFLSLPNPYLYVQFAPVAYIIKLYIELLMASLISKVVRSNENGRGEGWYSNSRERSNPTNYGLTSRAIITTTATGTKPSNTIMSRLGKEAPPAREGSNNGSEIHLATFPEPHGITKTVETTVVVDDGDDGRSESTFKGTYKETV
ncbi:hypothetical protein CEP52_012136 [Fusarium oligoseptatum]|uniref:Integral membrane protein n=1 Tax=Fusarium oligoseptatum TaxID=2604345 RepID=A0A428SZU3_9HYPO|nr:hypothetical protein CEP52_012136 [Fusarium oligoseptatum]